jgi:hypothetical protein
MDSRLREIVNGLLVRANPPDKVDTATRLQQEVVRRGLANELSEHDMAEAARAVGVPEEDLSDWLESMASWI